MTMQSRCLALVPRDGFFVKDGRGWYTSSSGRGHGLDWPWPSTILGALRTLWGRGEEARIGTTFKGEEWRSRTLPIRLARTVVLRRQPGASWESPDAIWPVPLDTRWAEGEVEVQRLDPEPHEVPTLGRHDDAATEQLWRARLEGETKPRNRPRWWCSDDFVQWLAGKPVKGRTSNPAMGHRVQVHVGIRPEEQSAADGVLFSHDVVETLELEAEWAIGVEIALPEGDLPKVATLGSDSRLARVESLPATLFDPPAAVLEAFRSGSAGLRLIATTPLCFSAGWLPDGLMPGQQGFRGRLPGFEPEVILRAAIVPRPCHVSGWDMVANQPKPTSRMVAPGAVYFFERADGQRFGPEEARQLWLAALGARTDEGFGRVVPGVWSPARSHS